MCRYFYDGFESSFENTSEGAALSNDIHICIHRRREREKRYLISHL